MSHVQYLQLKLRCANPRGVPVDKSIHLFDILRVFLQFRLNFHQLIHDGLMGPVRAMVIEWVVIHEWVPRVGWFISSPFSITIWQFGWFGGTTWYTHFRNETNHWEEMGTKKKYISVGPNLEFLQKIDLWCGQTSDMSLKSCSEILFMNNTCELIMISRVHVVYIYIQIKM